VPVDVENEQTVSRRALIRTAVWAAPVIVLATAAPAAAAASVEALQVRMLTTGIGSASASISLADGKNGDVGATPSRTDARAVLVEFFAANAAGQAVADATITVTTDGKREDQNNLVISVSPTSATSFPQASTGRLQTLSLSTGPTGTVQMKVSTAAFRGGDCGSTGRITGVISVTVQKDGYSTGTLVLPYDVFDNANAMAVCVPAPVPG